MSITEGEAEVPKPGSDVSFLTRNGSCTPTQAVVEADFSPYQSIYFEARSPADIDKVFSEITGARADALTVLVSGMLLGERSRGPRG